MTSITESTTRPLISSSKVAGTAVYNIEGEKLGSVDCVMIDKKTGEIAYAVMAFGGFLGMGEKRHPMPWQSLNYDTSKDGYVIRLSKDELKAAPVLDAGEYGRLNDRTYEETIYTHYKAEPYWL